MTITIDCNLPPISAYLDPQGLAQGRADYNIGRGYEAIDFGLDETATPYAFQWGDDYKPTLWFPVPRATINQEAI